MARGSATRRMRDLSWLFFPGLLLACDSGLEGLDDQRSARGTLGEEVYKVLCRRMAGVELPDDASGLASERLCLGNAGEVEDEVSERRAVLPARLVTLAEARAELASAVDQVLADELGDELEQLMRELLPFYDAPEERVQEASRALAAVLRALASDDAALEGLETVARDGMTPLEGAFGIARAMIAAEGFQGVLDQVLPALTSDARVKPGFDTLLSGLALELATGSSEGEAREDLLELKRLLAREVAVTTSEPLWVATRDARGLPVPTKRGDQAVPYPFVDANGDGLADATKGLFHGEGRFQGPIPAPFGVLREPAVARDGYARAYGFGADTAVDREHLLFETRDVAPTVLGVGLPQAAKLFDAAHGTFENLVRVTPALFGARVAVSRKYGKGALAFEASDASASPFVELVHASQALVDHPAYGDSLSLTERLVADEEASFSEALAPLLALERNTRNDGDLYPTAELADGATFWDELLYEAERISRRRTSQDGETTLEALLRAALGYARNLDKEGAPIERLVPTKVLRHQGAVLAALMRFKDEWRANPKGESKRAPDEDRVRGAFRTPVNRDAPDVPVTCGKDGCGGLIEGSAFADWLQKTPQQKCLLGNEGRSGDDCGTASNQSLYHRSLGLIWEMAGRSQANKRITMGDLLDFALLDDPCDHVEPEVSCVGDSASEKDAFCAGEFGSADFACDATRDVCVVKRSSATCQAYRQAQEEDRAQSIALAEDAVAEDYTCPEGGPLVACHEFVFTYPSAFIISEGSSEAAIQPGHLLDLKDVGRAFGSALIHEFVIQVPNPWVRRYLEDVARAADAGLATCDPGDIEDPRVVPTRKSDGVVCVPNAAKLSRDVYEDMPDSVDTLGELVEFLLDDSTLFVGDEDTAALRPEVEALSRVLFAPPGSSSFIVFDPLLVKGAPAQCTTAQASDACTMNQGKLDARGSCCLADLAEPPLRYRLDTYYGATTFAWEHPFKFSDGTELSFIASMRTLADAIDRTDFHAEDGDDPAAFESTDFVFSTLGKLVAEHYDSPQNPLVQSSDTQGIHYRRASNLVSYESLVADALDDGTVEDPLVAGESFAGAAHHLGLVFHSLPMLEALLGMTFEPERDGIDLMANLTELSLSAHARCAGEHGDRRVMAGKGACHRAEAGEAGLVAPLTYRDGTSTICWEDGRCFDKANDRRFVSPTYLLLDALGAMDDAIGSDEAQRTAARAALGGALDSYLALDGKKLADRRLHALLVSVLDHAEAEWQSDAASGMLATQRAETVSDAVDMLQNPVFAGALHALEELAHVDGALPALSAYAFALLDERKSAAPVRTLTLGLGDALESLPGSEHTDALSRVLAQALMPDVAKVLAGTAQPSIGEGYTFRSTTLLSDSAALDDGQVLARVLDNLAGVGSTDAAPLHVLWSVLARVQRSEPGSTSALDRDDLKLMLNTIADVMTDADHGFERVYELVRCRNGGADCS